MGDSRYGYPVGAVFFFNLLVGTAVLSMPKAFGSAGVVLSVLLITFICFVSYMSATFVTESLAAGNAVKKQKKKLAHTSGRYNPTGGSSPRLLSSHQSPVPPVLIGRSHSFTDLVTSSSNESLKIVTHDGALISGQSHDRNLRLANPMASYPPPPPLSPNESRRAAEYDLLLHRDVDDYRDMFEMSEKVEMGEIASMFLSRWLVIGFYACICIYLWGDLAIYAVAVPKSIRDVVCSNISAFDSAVDSDPCWTGHGISRINVYRLFLAAFASTFGIFAFFEVTKTTLLQLITSSIRWVSMIMMLVLSIIRIADGNGNPTPTYFDISGLPELFGVLVYAFMTHHSIATLTIPLKEKRFVNRMIMFDYVGVLFFYCIVSIVGVYAYANLDDLYTENFLGQAGVPVFCQYFIGLYPAMVLCTSFPIICVALRNNLKTLFRLILKRQHFPLLIDKIVFPLVTIVIPIAVAMGTDHVEILIGITGGYSGGFIEFFYPALFAYYSRNFVTRTYGQRAVNPMRSPFAHRFWVYFCVVWTGVILLITTLGLYLKFSSSQ